MKKNILTNTKIHVKNEEESRKVQELAFSLGYKWHSSLDKVSNLNTPYLFFYQDMDITYSTSMRHFNSHEYKLITFNELFPMEQKTKCIVLGQNEEHKKELRPIEFVKAVNLNTNTKADCLPYEYKNIELVCRNYADRFDLMFAYDEDRSSGCAYLGHWNDGIV